MGVGELVILDSFLHFSSSPPSLFECCSCFCILTFSSAFLREKVPSYYAELSDQQGKLALPPAVIHRRFFFIFSSQTQLTLLPSASLTFLLSSQSSVQDWGEEVEEGAVYNVTLKRVQIQQAANKGARWLGVSGRPTLTQSQLMETKRAPNPDQDSLIV